MENDRNHFASVEWTNKFLSDPLYKAIPTFSRVLKETGEDHFFARTIHSKSTLPHLVTLQLKDFQSPAESAKGQMGGKQNHTEVTPVPEHPDCIMLLALGQPGLDGHPGVIHGGMASAILDEMMGLCVMLHHQHIAGPRDSLFTANLDITFRRPVPTPGDIFVRTWLVGREGRKWLSHGQICNQDGQVLTEGRATWVLAKRQQKL